MTVYCQFWGGSNYACPWPDQWEEFDSLRAAKETFDERAHNEDYRFPCVDGAAAEMLIWCHNPGGPYPFDMAHNYPDYRLALGPRGGVRQERL